LNQWENEDGAAHAPNHGPDAAAGTQGGWVSCGTAAATAAEVPPELEGPCQCSTAHEVPDSEEEMEGAGCTADQGDGQGATPMGVGGIGGHPTAAHAAGRGGGRGSAGAFSSVFDEYEAVWGLERSGAATPPSAAA
jgi:hypothetical protein